MTNWGSERARARLLNGDRQSDEPPGARASLLWNSVAEHGVGPLLLECLDGHSPVDDEDPEPVKAFETSAQDFFCASLSMVGLLIHAAVGSLGGLGLRFPNRHGLAA